MHKSTDFHPEATPPEQPVLSRGLRLFDRYEVQSLLVQALEKTEHHRHLAEKVQACSKKFRHKRCDQNHGWARAENSCSCRVCPHCAHRRARMLGKRTQALVVGKTGLRYAVLAERNSKNLKAGITSLYKAWDRLRRSVRWKRKVVGSVVVLEVTYSKKRRTWHPHLNVLIEGEYFPFAELNQAWAKATNGKGRTTHIQQANEGTVQELLKYTLKVAERDDETGLTLIFDDPDALDEFLAGVYGMRLVRTYGTFHGLKVNDEAAPEEECPDCGSKCIVDIGRVYPDQLSFDFDKQVFRVTHAPSPMDHGLHFVRHARPSRISTNPESIAIAVEARRRAAQYERSVSNLFSERVA